VRRLGALLCSRRVARWRRRGGAAAGAAAPAAAAACQCALQRACPGCPRTRKSLFIAALKSSACWGAYSAAIPSSAPVWCPPRLEPPATAACGQTLIPGA
jgi:hypothetical protein